MMMLGLGAGTREWLQTRIRMQELITTKDHDDHEEEEWEDQAEAHDEDDDE